MQILLLITSQCKSYYLLQAFANENLIAIYISI